MSPHDNIQLHTVECSDRMVCERSCYAVWHVCVATSLSQIDIIAQSNIAQRECSIVRTVAVVVSEHMFRRCYGLSTAVLNFARSNYIATI